MRAYGTTGAYVGATTSVTLPTRTTYRTPRPKPAGHTWGDVVNPAVWGDATGIATCTHPRCTRAAVRSNACHRHWQAAEARERTRAAEAEHAPCRWCCKHFTRNTNEALSTYVARVYCGRTCAAEAQRKAIVAKAAAKPRPAATCTNCGETITEKRRVTCSRECAEARAKSARRKTETCTLPGCERPHRAKGMCHQHYHQQYRQKTNRKAAA